MAKKKKILDYFIVGLKLGLVNLLGVLIMLIPMEVVNVLIMVHMAFFALYLLYVPVHMTVIGWLVNKHKGWIFK